MRFLIAIFFVFISMQTYGQKKSNETDKKLLAGKWMSIEDNKYKIIVTDTNFVEYYDKEKPEKYSYKIENNKLTKIGIDGDVYEYDIMSLTKTHLTLMYLVRGNLLEFKRIN